MKIICSVMIQVLVGGGEFYCEEEGKHDLKLYYGSPSP